MTRERWVFLFAAISAGCALAAFCKVDVFTIAGLFGTGTNGAAFSLRDGFILVFLFGSFLLSGLGFYWSGAETIPRLTRNQKRLLLAEAARIRTLMRGILIASTNSDPATEPLARDLAQIFNHAGIAPWFVHGRPDNPHQSGLILCIRDLNNPPALTEGLRSVLKSANIPFTVGGFPSSGFNASGQTVGANNNVVLWVAPRPP